ncbi:hypothetical protein MLD38_001205 [Melastoma candidum]|uniref:Uncharacterized protein n=1 Tax=Melastoma candidum TaxID=119954 RepID=A0ACB9SCD7_9MYRT|nr:hypothetical protein MLD38_001205 [Melastoma candidum]
MSVSCGVECVLVLGCFRWAWKRCTYIGSDDSITWPIATPDEFESVPRICRVILAVYEADLDQPQYLPPGSVDPRSVVKRVNYDKTEGRAPPYLIYVDRENKDIVLALRGLNLVKDSDYKTLLDNRLGMQMFDGGYVHHGLMKAAVWVLNEEAETLGRLWQETGREYRMVFTGHSLGSGVAALLAVIAANHGEKLGGVPRKMVRCYAVAPARCMSLNLSVRYADVIHSIVLQDDFLPRTATPLEDIFKSIFCLPCLLFFVCLRDTFIPEGRKLRDPRRLYAPGRMYHIVERRFCRCGRYPPEVRTAIPVDGRFEHIVLSCNATSDHGIIWIEREAEKALHLMKERSTETARTPPRTQKMVRQQTFEEEHKIALERAVSLNIPHASEPLSDVSIEDTEEGNIPIEECQNDVDGKGPGGTPRGARNSWDEVVRKVLEKTRSEEQPDREKSRQIMTTNCVLT